MKKVRLGIIGIGSMGTYYTKTICEGKVPDMELTAVADVLPERRIWAAEFLGADFPVFEDAAKLFNSGLVDAVLIVTPHYQHPSLCIEALNAGLHVLCDKPAGVFTKDVREMNNIAAKSGKVFGIMFNQRTNPLYQKMRELVNSGNLGAMMRLDWTITNWFRTDFYYRNGGWRGTWKGEGGGVLINQSVHQLDLLQWICGMPKSVRAFCHFGKWHKIEVEDDVTAYFEFPNGATGTFITSTGEYPGENRFSISLEKGKIVYNAENELKVFKLYQSVTELNKTAEQGMPNPGFTLEKPYISSSNPQHSGVLCSFAGRILRGEPLVAEGQEGINSLLLSNAMYLSSWLDKTIDIPFDEDLFLAELNKRRG